MKHGLVLAAAAILAACSAPENPDYWSATRSGHGGQSSARDAAADGADYRAAALAEAGSVGSAMRPGLHKTRSGAPWLVAHSARFQAGGARQNGQAAAVMALEYLQREQSAPYAAQASQGEARTRFRIVTVDGSSFAVLFRIRLPRADLAAEDSAALRRLTAHAAEISGCRVTGPALSRRESGVIRRLAAPVICI